MGCLTPSHGDTERPQWNPCAAKDKFYYLVYMTKGGLTNADESMLLDVKDHFQQRLDERGVLMDLLWLEARLFQGTSSSLKAM